MWGLTACDGPADKTLTVGGRSREFHTYWARGAALGDVRDNGTALFAMRTTYGSRLFSTYGFLDAFNPTFTATGQQQAGTVDPALGWFDVDYLGIDQGPILASVENYRTQFVWTVMKRNPHIVRGLQRAGFTGAWLP